MRFLKLHPFPATCRLITALLFFQFCAVSVQAMNFQLGPDVSLDVDTQLKYEAAWRLKDPDSELVSEGNQNFDQGDMINNRISTMFDFDLQYKEYGLFFRPRAYFDFVYDDDKFSSETKDLHRDKVEILDAFAYGDFDLGNTTLSVRAGRQVVNWGEGLFIANNIGFAQNAGDATRLTSPGVELKDVYLPTAQLFSKLDFGTVSLSGFVKFEWDKVRIDERGAYWSTTDLLDEAGADVPILDLGPLGVVDIDQRDPEDASDTGEWGLALRYFADALNATEFGLYYLNYHEKLPMLIFSPTGGTYSVDPAILMSIDPTGALAYLDQTSYGVEYAEDVQLYGFTMSTEVFSWQIGPEVSYRQDYPVMVVDPNPLNAFGFTYVDADVLQAQVGFSRLYGGNMLYEELLVIGEVGFNSVLDEEGDVTLINDDFAWGFTLQVQPAWTNILPGLDLEVPISYSGNPSGDSSMAASFTESADSLGISLNFTYNQVYQFGIGYTTFFGDADDNSHADRDNISFNFRYTF